MAKRGRPRNPDCDGCGGPTNNDGYVINDNGEATVWFSCRRSRHCSGAQRTQDEIDGYW
jgi:hypothetical protein